MASSVCGDSLANALTLLNCNGERMLEGASFDWLFENPKLKEFLESFCKSTEYGKITFVEESLDKKYKNLEVSVLAFCAWVYQVKISFNAIVRKITWTS